MLVIQICREEGSDRPAADALEYLATELVRMTAAAHHRLQTLVPKPTG